MTSGKKFLSFLLIALSSVLFIGSLNLKPRQTYAEGTETKISRSYSTSNIGVGDYLEFGEYPQTELKNFTFRGADFDFEESTGYYKAKYNIVKNGETILKEGEKIHILSIANNYSEKYPVYMANANGDKISGSSYVNGGTKGERNPRGYVNDVYSTGSKWYYQSYYHSTNEYNTSTNYYFKVEPIKWKVIARDRDNGTLTLASTIVLDAMDFNLFDSNGNMWASSYLRNWLNYGSEYSNSIYYYMSQAQGRKSVYRVYDDYWRAYFTEWHDWGAYGNGNTNCGSSRYQYRNSAANTDNYLPAGKGSRGSVKDNYKSTGSFFNRAFVGAGVADRLVATTTTSYGNAPGVGDYAVKYNDQNDVNKNGVKSQQVQDYVRLVTMDQKTYKAVSGYSDYAVANGFVANFDTTTQAKKTRKVVEGGKRGYIWTMNTDVSDTGHQYQIWSSQGSIHNVRSVVGIDFRDNNYGYTEYAEFTNTKYTVSTGIKEGSYTARNYGKAPAYAVNSMQQSYGVAPQITVSKEALGDYLLIRNARDNETIEVDDGLHDVATSEVGVTFYVGKFLAPYAPGVTLTKMEDNGSSYTVAGRLNGNDKGYIKYVICDNDDATRDYIQYHKKHPSDIRSYGYASLDSGGNFSFDVYRGSGKMYMFYLTEDLKYGHLIEDNGDAFTPRERQLILYTYNIDSALPLTPDSSKWTGVPYSFLSNVSYTHNLGDPNTGASGTTGKWFRTKEDAENYLRTGNPANALTNYNITIPASTSTEPVCYYKVVAANPFNVSMAAISNYDGSYYIKTSDGNVIYPSGDNSMLFKGNTSRDLMFTIVIKYSHLYKDGANNNGYFYDTVKNEFKDLHYIITRHTNTSGDATTKNMIKIDFGADPTIDTDDTTKKIYSPNDGFIDASEVGDNVFKASPVTIKFNQNSTDSIVKEVEYQIIIPQVCCNEGYDFQLKKQSQNKNLSKYTIKFDTSDARNGDNSDKVYFDTKATINGNAKDQTISGISHDVAVSTTLKFRDGYYIKPTEQKIGTNTTLGIEIPDMGFSYAGIVRDAMGYRFADNKEAVYAYDSAEEAKYSYNGQRIRIDSLGRRINFDKNGNRIYTLQWTLGSNNMEVTLGDRNTEDGTYWYTRKAEGQNLNSIAVLLRPIYTVTLTNKLETLVFEFKEWNADESCYEGSEINDSTKTAKLKVQKNDSITISYGSFSGTVLVDNSKSPTKQVITGYTVSATSLYEIYYTERDGSQDITQPKYGDDMTGWDYLVDNANPEAGQVLLTPTDASSEDYGFRGSLTVGDNTADFTMTIANKNTRYYNPWVQYVVNTKLNLVAGIGSSDGIKIFRAFTEAGTGDKSTVLKLSDGTTFTGKTNQYLQFTNGFANTSKWFGNKVWFVEKKDGTIVQLTSLYGDMPAYNNRVMVMESDTGLGKVEYVDENGNTSWLTCFSIDAIDMAISYNLDTNVIYFDYVFDHVLSNMVLNFKNIAKYDYTIEFNTRLSRDSGKLNPYVVNSLIAHYGEQGMYINTAGVYSLFNQTDALALNNNLKTYINASVNQVVNGRLTKEYVMIFVPFTIGTTDYYLCQGGPDWTAEKLDSQMQYKGIDYDVIKLTRGSDLTVNYILVDPNKAQIDQGTSKLKYKEGVLNFISTAKEMIGFELADYGNKRRCITKDGNPIQATHILLGGDRYYYTIEQLMGATFVFEGNNTKLEFTALYDTCGINVSVNYWTASDGERDLIVDYLGNHTTEEVNFKTETENELKYYYLKNQTLGTNEYVNLKYGDIINNDYMKSNGAFEEWLNGKVEGYATLKGYYYSVDDVTSILTDSISNDGNYTITNNRYQEFTINGKTMYVYDGDFSRLILERVFDEDGVTPIGVIGYRRFDNGSTAYKSSNVQLITFFEVNNYTATVDLGDNTDKVSVDESRKTYYSGNVIAEPLEFTFTLEPAYSQINLTKEDFTITRGSETITDFYEVTPSGNDVFTLTIKAGVLTDNITITLSKTLDVNKYTIRYTNPTTSEAKPKNNDGTAYDVGVFSGFGATNANEVDYNDKVKFSFTQSSAIQLNAVELSIYVEGENKTYPFALKNDSVKELDNKVTTVSATLSGTTYTIKITGVVDNIVVSVAQYDDGKYKAPLKNYTLNVANDSKVIENTAVEKDNLARIVAETTADKGAANLYGDFITLTTTLTAGYTSNIPVFYINNTPIFPAWITGEGTLGNDITVISESGGYTYTPSAGGTIRIRPVSGQTGVYTVEIDGAGNDFATFTVSGRTFTLKFPAQFCEAPLTRNINVQVKVFEKTLTTQNVIDSCEQTFADAMDPANAHGNKFTYSTATSTATIGTLANGNINKVALEYGKTLTLKYVPDSKYTHTLPVLKVDGVPYYIPGLGVEYSDLGFKNGAYIYDYNGTSYKVVVDLNNLTFTYTQEVDGHTVTILKITMDTNYVFGGISVSADDVVSKISLANRLSAGITYTIELLVTGNKTIGNDVTYIENEYLVIFAKRIKLDENKYDTKGTMKLGEEPYTQTVVHGGVAVNPFGADSTLTNDQKALLGIEDGYSYSEDFNKNNAAWAVYNFNELKYDENYNMSTPVTENLVLAATFIENQYNVKFTKIDECFGYITSNLVANGTIGEDSKVFTSGDTETEKTRAISHSDINNKYTYTLNVLAKYDQTKPVFNFTYDNIGALPLFDSLSVDSTYEYNGNTYRYQDRGDGKILVRKSNEGNYENSDIYEYLYGKLTNTTDGQVFTVLLGFTMEEAVKATSNADRQSGVGKTYKISFNKVLSTLNTTTILASDGEFEISVSGFDVNNVNKYTVTRKIMLFKDIVAVPSESTEDGAVTTTVLNTALNSIGANGWLVKDEVMIYNGEYYLLEVDENENNVWYFLTTTPQAGHNYDRTTYYVDYEGNTKEYTHNTISATVTLDNYRGYKFDGWGTTTGLNDASKESYAVNKALTLYAHYSAVITRIVLPNRSKKATIITKHNEVAGTNYAKIAKAGEDGTIIGEISFVAEGTTIGESGNDRYIDLAYGSIVKFTATINAEYSTSDNDFNFLLDEDITVDAGNKNENYVKNIESVLNGFVEGVGKTRTYTITLSYVYFNSNATPSTTTLQCELNDVKQNTYKVNLYKPTKFDYESDDVTFGLVTANPEDETSISVVHGRNLRDTTGGEKLLNDANPTLEGWTPAGWYISNESFNSDAVKAFFKEGGDLSATEFNVYTKVYEDTNVYAIFTKNTFSVNIYNFCVDTNEFIDANQSLIDDVTAPITLSEIKYHTTIPSDDIGATLEGGKFSESTLYYVATSAFNDTLDKLRNGEIKLDNLDENSPIKVFEIGVTPVLENITILRGYTRNKFTVKFIQDGEVVENSTIEVFYGSKLTADQIPECTNIPYGYYFNAWINTDGKSGELTENTIITDNTSFEVNASGFVGFKANEYAFKFTILSETGEVVERGYSVGGNTNVSFDNGVLKVPYVQGSDSKLLTVIFQPKTGYATEDANLLIITVKYNGKEIELPFVPEKRGNAWYISLGNSTLKGLDINNKTISEPAEIDKIVERFNDGDLFEVTIGAKKNVYSSIVTETTTWQYGDYTYTLVSANDSKTGYSYSYIYDANRTNNVPLKLTAKPTEHGDAMEVIVEVSSFYNYTSKFYISLTDGTTTKQFVVDNSSLSENRVGDILTYSSILTFENVTNNLTLTVDTSSTNITNNDYDITFHMVFGGGVNGWFDREIFFKDNTWSRNSNGADKVQAKYIPNSENSRKIEGFEKYRIPNAKAFYPSATDEWCEPATEIASWYRLKKALDSNKVNFADITKDNWSDYFEAVKSSDTYDRNTKLYAIFFVNTVNVTVETEQEASKGKFVGANGKADMIDPKIEDMAGRGYTFKYVVATEYSNNIPVITIGGNDIVILPYSVFSNMEVGKGVEVKKSESVVYTVTRTAEGYNYSTNGGSTYTVKYSDGRYVFSSLNVVVIPNGAEYTITLNSISGAFSLSSNQSMFTINRYKVTYVLPDGTKQVEEVEYGKTLVDIPKVSTNFFQKLVYKVRYANGKTEIVNAKSVKNIEFTSNATIEIEVQINVVMVSLVAAAGLAVIVTIVIVAINAKRNKAYKKKAQSENAEAFAQLKQKEQKKSDKDQNGENGPKI